MPATLEERDGFSISEKRDYVAEEAYHEREPKD